MRFVNDFLVRQRGLRGRVPVNHAPAAIDQFLFVKIDKDLFDRANIIVVEGIAPAGPVAGATESLELLNNDAAVFVLPFEHALQKFLAAEIVTRHAFVFAEPLFDRGLGSNSGVIHPRQPKHFETLHPRASGKNVLNAVVQNVAEREHAGDVRRRHHDRERFVLRSRVRLEVVIVDPTLIPLRLNRSRIVGFGKLSHCEESSERQRGLQEARAIEGNRPYQRCLRPDVTAMSFGAA